MVASPAAPLDEKPSLPPAAPRTGPLGHAERTLHSLHSRKMEGRERALLSNKGQGILLAGPGGQGGLEFRVLTCIYPESPILSFKALFLLYQALDFGIRGPLSLEFSLL